MRLRCPAREEAEADEVLGDAHDGHEGPAGGCRRQVDVNAASRRQLLGRARHRPGSRRQWHPEKVDAVYERPAAEIEVASEQPHQVRNGMSGRRLTGRPPVATGGPPSSGAIQKS